MASDDKPNLFKMEFAGGDVSNTMVPLIFKDDDGMPLSFTPLPAAVECIDTTDPIGALNYVRPGTSILTQSTQCPGRPVLCRAKSRTSEDHFLIKIVLRLERETNSFQFDLHREERFYAQSPPAFQGIVPRHYGLFITKSSWGGKICAAVMDYFGGLPWDHLPLPAQYA
jgi:hypothetical protein